jgi:hypothetical protein
MISFQLCLVGSGFEENLTVGSINLSLSKNNEADSVPACIVVCHVLSHSLIGYTFVTSLFICNKR